MKRVIVESPFKGDVARNRRYLEFCLRDCIMRGESPYASHKMLTDCLDDDKPEERELGIQSGFVWKQAAEASIFYIDLGWSGGMLKAYEFCGARGLPYETRKLSADLYVAWLEAEETSTDEEEPESYRERLFTEGGEPPHNCVCCNAAMGSDPDADLWISFVSAEVDMDVCRGLPS